jgi:hypothetical protein
MAAMLSPDGNPLSLRANASAVTAAQVQAKVDAIKTLLQPLRTTVADDVDPLTGQFSADGTGHDKLLDTLDIQIRPAGAVSNIELSVRGTDETLRTAFTSATAAPAPLPAVSSSTLPPDNITPMLDGLMQRMTACYALPLSKRVGTATSDTGSATGTGADIIATECRTPFLGDDPTSFLHNGSRVGRDSAGNGAFAGIFRSGATGVVFENASLQWLRNNPEKDIVVLYRNRDTQGVIAYDQLVARNVGGVLKLVGNQYVYAARVRPFAQDREFLNQPAADYVSVGFNVNITNRVDAAGIPVFSKVLVTAPNGATLTFVPTPGRGSLSVVKGDGTVSNTPVVRLAAKFKNSTTSGNPATFETGVFVVSPQFTDDQLRAIPEHGSWRLEFFHADAATANVVQTYRTPERAPTLAELNQVVFAAITAAERTELIASSAQFGAVVFGAPSASTPNVADVSAPGGADFWTVPSGAVAPTTVTVFGAGPDPDGTGPLRRISFDDGVNVSQLARKAFITCAPQSASDNHCDSSTGVRQYAQNTSINSVELFGSSARLVEHSKMLALYYLLPR